MGEVNNQQMVKWRSNKDNNILTLAIENVNEINLDPPSNCIIPNTNNCKVHTQIITNNNKLHDLKLALCSRFDK